MAFAVSWEVFYIHFLSQTVGQDFKFHLIPPLSIHINTENVVGVRMQLHTGG